MPARAGRAALMATALGGFVVSLTVLFYVARDGAVHPDGVKYGVKQVLEIYLPVLAIMGAFYFTGVGDGADAEHRSSTQSFVFAYVVSAVWLVAPPLLLGLTTWPVEGIFEFLNDDSVGILGKTLAAGAVTYYFSRFD